MEEWERVPFSAMTAEQKRAREEFLVALPNAELQAKVAMATRVIDTHQQIAVSVSGGADSDCLLDWMWHLDVQKKCRYFFVDTGMEMQSQKDQIRYLQQRYGVEIHTIRPKLPTAASVRAHGYPFLSKKCSQYIYRLQQKGFKWEDEPFEYLAEKYQNCTSALRWWCNRGIKGPHKPNQDEVGHFKWLKEFMVQNPPDFLISDHCCHDSKKQPLNMINKNADLRCMGMRRQEGGVRAVAYTNCFQEVSGKADIYVPLFFWSDKDKEEYCRAFDIRHSAAYTQYGMKRTGCAGCPYNSWWEQDLLALDRYEPKLAAACRVIFAPSYEYSRKFKAFKAEMNRKEKLGGQMEMEEFL